MSQSGKKDTPLSSCRSDGSQSHISTDSASPTLSDTSESTSPDRDLDETGSTSKGGRLNAGGKRARKLLTHEQSRVLHELLQQTCFPSTQVREAVAAQLGLSPRKVQVFFQNKRQKQRRKSNMSAPSQVRNAQRQSVLRAQYAQRSPSNSPIAERTNPTQLLYFQAPSSTTATQPVTTLESSSVGPRAQLESCGNNAFNSHANLHGWPRRLSDWRRSRDRHNQYYMEHRPDRVDSYTYGSIDDRPVLNPVRAKPLKTYGQPQSPTVLSRTLPPIVSDVRSSTTKLPSIDELVSHSQC